MNAVVFGLLVLLSMGAGIAVRIGTGYHSYGWVLFLVLLIFIMLVDQICLAIRKE